MNKLLLLFLLTTTPILAMEDSEDGLSSRAKCKQYVNEHLIEKERECVNIITSIKLQFLQSPSPYSVDTYQFYQEIMKDLELEAKEWSLSQSTLHPYLKNKEKNDLLRMAIWYGAYLEKFELICKSDQCMYKTLERDIFSHYGLKINTIIKGIDLLGGFTKTTLAE